MYTPKSFEVNDPKFLYWVMKQYNFVTVISQCDPVPMISHVPVILEETVGKNGVLSFHLSRLNAHIEELDGKKKAVCIFHGPHGYISPAWYKSFPSVPTWNYVVVHAHGKPAQMKEKELSEHLKDLVVLHEKTLKKEPYIVPAEYQKKLMEHIVGFKMEIDSIEGKFKLSQNRDPLDQESVIENLYKNGENELADFMKCVRE